MAAELAPKQISYRAGFGALLGRPNVGKSTLVNRIVGSKIAIVSPKPQTTRGRILGLYHEPNAQLILVDTPGVSAGVAALPKALRKMARAAACDADVMVLMVAVRAGECRLTEEDEAVLSLARRSPASRIIALNKVDLMADKRKLLPWIAAWSSAHPSEAIVPISARTGEGVDTLRQLMVDRLPEGPALFPTDQHTDQAERALCQELIREQLLMQLAEEVPHSAAVVIEEFEDDRDSQRPICRLYGRIIVERDGQKAIVIGHKGGQLKAISTAARHQIEELLGADVFLRLHVTVDPKWTSKADALRGYGIGLGAT